MDQRRKHRYITRRVMVCHTYLWPPCSLCDHNEGPLNTAPRFLLKNIRPVLVVPGEQVFLGLPFEGTAIGAKGEL